MISIKMDGWKELAAGLEALGNDRAIRTTMKNALLKRTFPLIAMAQSRAKKNIKISASTTLSKHQRGGRTKAAPGMNQVTVYVGAERSPLAVIDEFGTAPRHWKSGKSTGQEAPAPAMRPAWEATKDQILAGFAEDLGAEIERSATRIGRKQARLIRAGH